MIHAGDALTVLRSLPDASANCCVTSPPYWGLRDYGVDGQLGLEATPEEYVAGMVAVFREVRRVLLDDGTLWLNIGDSYAVSGCAPPRPDHSGASLNGTYGKQAYSAASTGPRRTRPATLKPKDLVGIPWRLAFALQADGWYLRSDIIWAKPNPLPESVTDRPTKSHEYVFLLSKSARYWYDADAINETARNAGRVVKYDGTQKNCTAGDAVNDRRTLIDSDREVAATRNARTVWTIATRPFPEAHFATFPPELPTRCIKAGCPKGGTVLDPFVGAGTTGLVAQRLGRSFVGIELNTEYAEMARRRIYEDAPLFNDKEKL